MQELKVKNVELLPIANGAHAGENFKKVTFAHVAETGRMSSKSDAVRVFMPWDAAFGVFTKETIGLIVDGASKQTFATSPYEIVNDNGVKTVATTYSCVVLDGENGLAYAARQFNGQAVTVTDIATGDSLTSRSEAEQTARRAAYAATPAAENVPA